MNGAETEVSSRSNLGHGGELPFPNLERRDLFERQPSGLSEDPAATIYVSWQDGDFREKREIICER